jgi:hypothetical protein
MPGNPGLELIPEKFAGFPHFTNEAARMWSKRKDILLR